MKRIDFYAILITGLYLLYLTLFRESGHFPDTPEYLSLQQYSLLSIDFWKGVFFPSSRPGILLLIYSLLKDVYWIGAFQISLHMIAWSCLALFVKHSSKFHPFLGNIRGAWILIGAFYFEFFGWASIPLSESIAQSFLLFWIMLCFWKKRLFFKNIYFEIVATSALFYILLSPRDTNAYLVLPVVMGTFISVKAIKRLSKTSPDIGAKTGANSGNDSETDHLNFLPKRLLSTVAAALLLIVTNTNSHRYRHAMDHVIQNRVNKSPELTQIFSDLGMPRYNATECEVTPAITKTPAPLHCQENIKNYYAWLTDKSKSTLAKFLLFYPKQSILKVVPEIKELMSNDFLPQYHEDKMPEFYLKRLADTFWPFGDKERQNNWSYAFSFWFFSILLCLLLKKRSFLKNHFFWFTFTLPVSGVLNIWMNYHVDTIEIQRHCMQAILFIKLGILLQIFLLIDSLQLHQYSFRLNSLLKRSPA